MIFGWHGSSSFYNFAGTLLSLDKFLSSLVIIFFMKQYATATCSCYLAYAQKTLKNMPGNISVRQVVQAHFFHAFSLRLLHLVVSQSTSLNKQLETEFCLQCNVWIEYSIFLRSIILQRLLFCCNSFLQVLNCQLRSFDEEMCYRDIHL